MRIILKSKISRAVVTEAELHYEGSITIDEALLEAADILPYEKVEVLDVNNGARIETYAIKGKRNSGIVCMNGPSARSVCVGDQIMVLAYAQLEEKQALELKPRIILVDKDNKIKR